MMAGPGIFKRRGHSRKQGVKIKMLEEEVTCRRVTGDGLFVCLLCPLWLCIPVC